MTIRSRETSGDETLGGREARGERGGVGRLLKSLFTGIHWSECAEGEELLHLEPPISKQLSIHNANGRTVVTGEERQDIVIHAHKQARGESREAAERLLAAIRIRTDFVGDDLQVEVEVPTKWNRHGNANLEVKIPNELFVAVAAANGKVTLKDIKSAVTARSSNGAVRIFNVAGDVQAFTSNAPVTCSGTCGSLVCRSSNGKIKLCEHTGSVDASTSNGQIQASLEAVGSEGVNLATSNGRIVLELPEEVDAEIDMRVDNGVIRTERDVEQEAGEANGRVRGRLGEGGALIKLRTSNGTISLR